MKILVLALFCFGVLEAASQVDSVYRTDSLRFDTVDARPKTAQGNLFRDDPQYNRRYSIGGTLARVTSANLFNWAFNRYLLKEEWTDVSLETWKYNLKHGWEWDADRFGVNFIGHPHSGS